MEIKPIKTEQLSSGVVNVVGAGAGFMLPGALANMVAKVKAETVVTEAQKKKKLMVNAACILAGIAGSLAVSGKDTVAEGVRALCTGIAGGGIKGVASHLLEKEIAKTDAASNKGMLLRGALGCPQSTMNQSRITHYPTLNRPGRLRQPIFQSNPSLEIGTNDPLS